GADNGGQKLVADIDRDKDSTGVGCAETIGQIKHLQRQPMAQIKTDTLDAVHMCVRSRMDGRGVPTQKTVVRSPKKYIDESLGLDEADLALIKRFASESVTALRIERVNSEKLSGSEQIDNGLSLAPCDI